MYWSNVIQGSNVFLHNHALLQRTIKSDVVKDPAFVFVLCAKALWLRDCTERTSYEHVTSHLFKPNSVRSGTTPPLGMLQDTVAAEWC